MLDRTVKWATLQVGEGRAAIAIHDPQGHPGVHGICAAKLVELTGRPVAYFSPRGESDYLSGSLRTTNGFHVREALREIADELGCRVIAWGGHAGAGGITIHRDAFNSFAMTWDSLAASQISRSEQGPRLFTDGALVGPPTLYIVNELSRLEPFGRHWEQPLFRARAKVKHVRSVGDGTHLTLDIIVSGAQQEAIWFGAVDDQGPPVHEGQTIDVAFELDENTFRDSTRLQLRVRHATAAA